MIDYYLPPEKELDFEASQSRLLIKLTGGR